MTDPASEKPTILGVISDTRALWRRKAITILRGCDQILHAGDVGASEILETLADIPPVTAVRGNVDTGPWARALPATQVVAAGGVTIYILHDLAQLDLKPEAAGFGVVISGHSHKPCTEEKRGVLYFNPGSAGPRRFNLPVSVGKLLIQPGKVQAELIELMA